MSRLTAGALLLLLACGPDGADPDEVSLADELLEGPPMDHSAFGAALDRLEPGGDADDDPDADGASEADPRDGAVRAFYARRGDRPAWVDPWGHPGEAARGLRAALASAPDHGVSPDAIDAVEALWRPVADGQPAVDAVHALDIALTRAFFDHARALSRGRVDPATVGWEMQPPPVDPLPYLEVALAQQDVGAALDRLAPPHPEYRALRTALARYRAVALQGGWPAIPGDAPLAEGDAAEPDVLAALERRLTLEGWLDGRGVVIPEPPDTDTDTGDTGDTGDLADGVYGPRLAAAVRRFQEANGLTPDGVLGPGTRAALDVPVEERVRTLEINLERWRWMPERLGARHVLVDLPGFRLQVRERGRVVLEMPVVIGQPSWKTPVFSDRIERVVFHPYWGVPPSILREEMMPRIRKDPGYLARNNYEVVDARGRPVSPAGADWSRVYVRQRPGAGNALGKVKFLFPNDHAVYLHDTPARHLFSRPERAFSHGCVRVGDPEALAKELVGRNEGWGADRVEAALASGRHRSVSLDETVPVHLVYFTAWPTGDGRVGFRPDVYGADAALAERLEAGGQRDDGRVK